jgi:hypothetical protein
MEEATLLSTKEIRGDQGDHGGRGPSVPISTISPSWQGPLARGSAGGIRSPGDGRHLEPRQASAITVKIKLLTNLNLNYEYILIKLIYFS